MTSAVYTTPNYQQKVIVKPAERPNKREVIFLPTFVDLKTPIRNLIKALQWRNQISEFLNGLVSGAASLR